ncbi:MAG: radical SAM protein [Candidatus Omnitrophota bacterium]
MVKNILLINPWICDFAAYDLWMFPLGILKIASLIKDTRVRLDFVNFLDRSQGTSFKIKKDASRTSSYGTGRFNKELIEKPAPVEAVPRPYFRYGLPELILRDKLKTLRPDLILVTSGMTYWYPGVKQTIELLKRVFGDCPVILGGVYATLCPEHARRYSCADSVFSGGSMQDILELIGKYLGIELVQRPRQEVLPDFELLPKKDVLPVQASKGCPFRCTYCAVHLLEPELKQADPGSIINHIVRCFKNFGTHDFVFYDDALLLNAEQVIKPILRELIKAALPIRFHTPNGLHARFIDRELAILMKKSGFTNIRLSLESTLGSIQKKSDNKVTTLELREAAVNLKNAGFKKQNIAVYTLIGLPGQGEEDVLEDMRFIHDLGVEIELASFSLVPGTAEWKTLRDKSVIGLETDLLQLSHTAFPLLFGGWNMHTIKKLRLQAKSLNAA